MHPHPFDISDISRRIWEEKYQLRDSGSIPTDDTVSDTWARVARAAAQIEAESDRERWYGKFVEVMEDFTFLPAGRIIAGAGSGRDVTLFNCFVMGVIDDDLGSIFEQVREAALTMQKGGGIGHDFSTLRPRGAPVASLGADASGPVSFMDVWDAMCRTIMSAGSRRGAMMGTLRCDHPDIETFIEAKQDPARLRNFNVSVLVPDDFITALRADRDWELKFGGKVYRKVRARDLWERMIRATYEYAEPGVIFIDRINARNNLAYCETIGATNPCGEQPLPPYGACLLGSINLARLVASPFQENADIDAVVLEDHVATAVRLLDNIVDVSRYPLPAQDREAKDKRRIGLGVTGLADALIFCGLHYDSDTARERAGRWMSIIQNAAYRASAELAGEKGSFPLYDAAEFARSPNVEALEPDVQAAIARHGIRNGCLTSIAPTGTISLLAGNVSSGIEPVFATSYSRRVLQPDNSTRTETVADYAAALHAKLHPGDELPETFVTTADLSVGAHLKMQSAIQAHVDSSISKTINCPAEIPFDAFKNVYLDAFDLGLKGCTTFRPNPVTGAVLTEASEAASPGAVERSVARESDQESATAEPAFDRAGGIVFMTEPLEREPALAGYTYKLKWPGSAHAIYVTINDIEQNGRRRPFEIFINTKNLDHQAWTVALTRMISAVFRRGGDVSFVVEELKAIFDPQGGQWLGGRYVPSLLAAIGDIIESHMIRTGFLSEQAEDDAGQGNLEQMPNLRSASGTDMTGPPQISPVSAIASGKSPTDISLPVALPTSGKNHPMSGQLCPRCGQAAMQSQEGCRVCRACGYSHCG